MDSLLSDLPLEALRSPDLGHLLQAATGAFLAFTLVVTRMTGMVVLGPVFGHPHVPIQVRAFLVLALSLVITPVLVGTSFLTLPVPESLFEYAGLMVVELALGIALGLGVSTIISGLQMAGSLIDQQIGTSLGSVFNPQFQNDSSLSGELLNQLGLAVFLIAGGHLLMISALIDTFQALPVGYAWVSADLIELLSSFVHQSLVLAVQVSAPVMATMALVGLAIGFLGHSIPQLNVMVVGFPVRTLVGLLLLGLALPATAELLAQVLPGGIEQLRQVMLGGPE